MIYLQPSASIMFKSHFSRNNNTTASNHKIAGISAIGLAGVAAAGTAAVAAGKGKAAKMNYEEALTKAGVELKDGLAYIKSTGEKYTGKIKRNISINKKETVNFEEGIMTERLHHNMFGREMDGEFFENGKLKLKVGNHTGLIWKSFPFYVFENGDKVSSGDVLSTKIRSVFEWARKAVKDKEKIS